MGHVIEELALGGQHGRHLFGHVIEAAGHITKFVPALTQRWVDPGLRVILELHHLLLQAAQRPADAPEQHQPQCQGHQGGQPHH